MPEIVGKLLNRLDISSLRFARLNETEAKKPSILKEVVDNPELFKLEAFIEGEAIQVTISKR